MKEKKSVMKRIAFHLEHWQTITVFLMIYDVLAVNMAYFAALWFRFDCRYESIPKEYLAAYLRFVPIYSVFCVLVFIALRLYKSIWRFASYSELIRVAMSTVVTSLMQMVGVTWMYHLVNSRQYGRLPISYYVFGTFFQFFLILAIRFSYRFVLLLKNRRQNENADTYAGRIMLIGAGNAGQMILRELQRAKEITG